MHSNNEALQTRSAALPTGLDDLAASRDKDWRSEMLANDPIFVIYPRGYRSGGPEALHQLVDSLRRHGQDAFLVAQPGTEHRPRDAHFDVYDAPESSLRDVSNGALIVPEYLMAALDDVKYLKRFCWWLSIDNAPQLRWQRRRETGRARGGLGESLAAGAEFVRTSKYRRRRWLESVTHLTQSQYARAFLNDKFGINAKMLSDYIKSPSGSFMQAKASRSVAYNPAKMPAGFSLLEQLLPDVSFVPLVNMTQDEVRDALALCEVYLDLGHHPGKDRLPREAALMGAVVVVADQGSGAFYSDVPLGQTYKIPAGEGMIEHAAQCVRLVLEQPSFHRQAQNSYVETIRADRRLFDEEVSHILAALRSP